MSGAISLVKPSAISKGPGPAVLPETSLIFVRKAEHYPNSETKPIFLLAERENPYSNKSSDDISSFEQGNFGKRGGWTPGWGWKSQSSKSSPATKALALLGFLFYLYLIQMSLMKSQEMMTSSTMTTTTTLAPPAQLFRSSLRSVESRQGRVRQKRGLKLHHNQKSPTPDSVLTHPSRKSWDNLPSSVELIGPKSSFPMRQKILAQ